MLRGHQDSLEQPALKELRRSGIPSVEALEQATEKIFGDESARRRGRMKLYVLKKYSGLTSTTIAQRYNRRHSAFSMAVKAIEEDASTSPTLRKRLAQLSRIIEKSDT